MKKITAYEIALSALACAIAVICLTVGVYSEILLFSGYMLAAVAMMLPLSKGAYVGYGLAYLAACILSVLFSAARFWDVLPFIMFFGLHPFVNEMQLKIKINRWVACGIKALWFDVALYLIWRFIFGMTSSISGLDAYMVPIIFVLGTLFFGFYDYCMYRARDVVYRLVARISKK
jgi:hypothetical protein